MRHAARGALEAEHQRPLEVVLRAPQFARVEAAGLHLPNLRDDHIDQFRHHVVAAPGVDAEGTRILVRRQARKHRVGQATLLADVLEQARAHRAAERGVERIAGVTFRVVLWQGRRAEHDVTLLQILLANLDRRRGDRHRVLGFGATVRNLRERAFEQRLHVVVLEIADGDHYEVLGHVGVAKILLQGVAIEGVDAGGGAENRTAERMAAPEAFGENLVDQIVGRVLDHLDLFEDDLLFFLDVVVSQQRIADQVGEDLHGEREVLVQHLQVVAGVFLGGEGVDLATDRIHLLSYFFGRPGGCAFEEHVLDEVRDAHAFRRLVARPPCEPDADGNRAHVRHPFGGKTDTVGKDGATNVGLRHCVGFCRR